MADPKALLRRQVKGGGFKADGGYFRGDCNLGAENSAPLKALMRESRGQPSFPSLQWQRPPADLSAPTLNVDLWRMDFEEARFAEASFRCLSLEERERAGRFRFERDRRLFCAVHAGKRRILSRYLRVPAEEIAFCEGACGKPTLALPETTPSIQFNISHSKGLALLAVRWGGKVGVDVETLHPVQRMAPIFNRFASAAEKAAFAAAPSRENDSGQLLTAWWVEKEAFVKAVGRGLSLPFARFSIELDDAGEWKLAEMGKDFGEVSDWSLRLFSVGSYHLGAVATRPPAPSIRAFREEC